MPTDTDRLRLHEDFLRKLARFEAKVESFEQTDYQRAARAIDRALTKTMGYIEAEKEGRSLPALQQRVSAEPAHRSQEGLPCSICPIRPLGMRDQIG
jgi:hypothetical protein